MEDIRLGRDHPCTRTVPAGCGPDGKPHSEGGREEWQHPEDSASWVRSWEEGWTGFDNHQQEKMPTSSFLEMLIFKVLLGLQCHHPTKERRKQVWKARGIWSWRLGSHLLGIYGRSQRIGKRESPTSFFLDVEGEP